MVRTLDDEPGEFIVITVLSALVLAAAIALLAGTLQPIAERVALPTWPAYLSIPAIVFLVPLPSPR